MFQLVSFELQEHVRDQIDGQALGSWRTCFCGALAFEEKQELSCKAASGNLPSLPAAIAWVQGHTLHARKGHDIAYRTS